MTKAFRAARDETRPPAPEHNASPSPDAPPAPVSAAACALRLADAAASTAAVTLYLAGDEGRAEDLATALGAIAPKLQTLALPGWDCLPYDRASPSRSVMGRRMRVLAALATPTAEGRVLITTPEALVQKLPPTPQADDTELTLSVGQSCDRSALTAFAERCGYLAGDQVDEPGDVALLAEVLDVYPPGAPHPYRLRLDADDKILEIDVYDAVTQRSCGAVDQVVIGPASELLKEAGDPRIPGEEHRLGAVHPHLRTLFEVAAFDEIWLEAEVQARAEALLEQAADAYSAETVWGGREEAPLEPSALYLTLKELNAGLSSARPIEDLVAGVEPGARFAAAPDPGGALIAYLTLQRTQQRRLILSGQPHELAGLKRAYRRGFGEPLAEQASWAEAIDGPGGGAVAVAADFDAGFIDPAANLTLVAASDVYGARVVRRGERRRALLSEPDLQIGDVVIHEDHGVGVLRALERVELDGRLREVVRLGYAGGSDVLAPVSEMGRIWRYGAEAGSVGLDRLKGEGWNRRRAQASRQIKADAKALVAQARRREQQQTAPVVPPKPAFARFCARFAYPETPDQRDAIAAVLSDLASGRPMDRLICGDVGFGKTEVALRAAAAVLLSGRQVAVAAPTTVLARQHLTTFKRRFAGFGVEVAQLSRLSSGEDVARAKAGLASGEVQLVIGTHALAAQDVAFADLALIILDEEQKFGAKLKAALRARAPHQLCLTATPIPRTLQAALLGAQDVSVIADPPAKRRPVRTIVEPFNPAAVHTALLREAKRGGQSFVVAPRIGDLGPLIEELRDLVPTLTIVTAHGEMPPEAVDEAMVGFAEGRGDVLVATNIIESGLDVPRANTILVVGAERFGLAQLHQLRGRVGRGRTQGAAYLFTDPHKDPEPTTLARLTTLQAFDHLGAGLELAGQDLDVRGAGDLTGEDQAGHIKLIGAGLYQKLMQRAVRSAQGETLEASWSPQIQAEDEGLLEDAYVPDPATRLALYARLAGVETLAALDALAEEIDDRFGPLTPAAATLLALARLRLLAKTAAVQSVRLGPKAAALVPRKAAAARIRRLTAEDLEWRDDRLIIYASGDAADETPTGGPPLLKRTAALLQMLSAARGGRRKTKRPAGEEVKARTDG